MSTALARQVHKERAKALAIVKAKQYAHLRIVEGKTPQVCADAMGVTLAALRAYTWRHKAEMEVARAEAMAVVNAAVAESALAMRMKLAGNTEEAVDTVVAVMKGTADEGAKDNARVRAAQVVMERVDPIMKSHGGQVVNIKDSVILQAAGPLKDFDYEAAGVEVMEGGVDASEEQGTIQLHAGDSPRDEVEGWSDEGAGEGVRGWSEPEGASGEDG